jgi:alkylation response protein AidB-like acyl-CoA dehydrogenase
MRRTGEGDSGRRDAYVISMAASGTAHRDVLRRHDGMGFMGDCGVERAGREAAAMLSIVEGTSDIRQLLMARGVLEGSRAS